MELPQNLGQFIARDLVFMTGGAGVIASGLCALDRLPDSNTPGAFYILTLGVGYAVGFAIQEVFSMIGLVTTHNVYRPCRLLRWWYHRYDQLEWQNEIAESIDELELRAAVRRSTNTGERWWANHERIITHMMVGSTLGPCAFVSAVLLLAISWPVFGSTTDAVARAMGLSCLGLAIVLWPLNWLKAMQITVREIEICIAER